MDRFEPKTLGLAILAGVGIAGLAACDNEPSPPEVSLPYATEYPEVAYAASTPAGAVGRLAGQLHEGDIDLAFGEQRGYLDAVLDALEIDASSQVLVYSRTSQQVRNILPSTPRAIYFNDETYVAWIPGAPTLEIASYDAELGPVFYTLPQTRAAASMERQFGSCLRCHDTYSLTGGGVPRFLLGSGYTGTDGELVSHEAWILTSPATPFRNRWGGWYVTGRHGQAGHLGNIVVENIEDLQDIDALRIGNVDDLGDLFPADDYLGASSDIVALLVLEHQVEVQNAMNRLNFEASSPDVDAARLAPHIEDLLEAMLMLDEIELPEPVAGSPAFAEYFESLGPFDAAGRSLRELDLSAYVFRYPLSYLVYSPGFAALPPIAREGVLVRLREVLASSPEQDGMTRLGNDDRAVIRAILTETLPDF